MDKFRYGQRVSIEFPTYVRQGYVQQDDDGPKVLVRWWSQKKYVGGPHGPRRILLYQPRHHDQWFPRERLTARGPRVR